MVVIWREATVVVLLLLLLLLKVLLLLVVECQGTVHQVLVDGLQEALVVGIQGRMVPWVEQM